MTSTGQNRLLQSLQPRMQGNFRLILLVTDPAVHKLLLFELGYGLLQTLTLVIGDG